MTKLQVLENKKLKIVNVFTKELRGIQIEELDREIQKFINFLDISQIQTRGPLITKNIGTNIHGDGTISVDYDAMVQTVNKMPNNGDFKFYETITVENCLYVHFEGMNEELAYAQSKLQLHLWENNLVELGEEYMIHLSADNEWFEVDIFKPVE